MILRSSLTLVLLGILLLHALDAINPAYLQQDHQERLAALIDRMKNRDNEQRMDPDLLSSERQEANTDDEPNDNSTGDDDDGPLAKRNKYTNFHLSPLWLSRRTRTNRFYGKPLWISRNG